MQAAQGRGAIFVCPDGRISGLCRRQNRRNCCCSKPALTFRLIDSTASAIKWLFADHVVRVSSADKKAYSRSYPFEVIQVWSPKHYPPPPFHVDARFRSAFKAVIYEVTPKRIMNLKSVIPSAALVDKVHAHYTAGGYG